MFEGETDAALVARARADESYAFDLLIERYQMLLLSIALRYCRDEEVARDLVQEALLQAYLSLDRLRDDTRFKSWLYGITLNICRNWLRASKSKIQPLPTLDTIAPDPHDLLEEQEIQHIVHEALAMLSPRNRSVAQLFYYEQLSMQEIAHQLDISLAAVKSRLHKGREQLRSHFTQHHPDLLWNIGKRGRTIMVPVRLAKVQHLEKLFRTVLVLLDEQVKSATFHLTILGKPLETESSRRQQYATDTRQQPIEGSSAWTRCELVIDVPSDAFSIQASFNLTGEGKLWLAPIRFEIVDKSVPLTGTQIVPPPRQPQNLDFAQDLLYWTLEGTFPQDYQIAIDHEIAYQDHPSLTLRASTPEARGTGTLQQTISTFDYQGKRVLLAGMVKTVDVVENAEFYLSSNLGKRGERIERTIHGTTDWTLYEITLHVNEQDMFLNFGLTLRGKGQVWLTNVEFSVV